MSNTSVLSIHESQTVGPGIPLRVETMTGCAIYESKLAGVAIASLLGEPVILIHNDEDFLCKPEVAPSWERSHRAAQMATRLREAAAEQPNAPVHGFTVRLLLEALAREVDGKQ